MSVVRAGDLIHRVTVQETVRSDDGAGGHTLSFVGRATVSARVMGTGGREVMEAKKLNPKITHVVRMRWRSDVDATQRLLFDGRALNIVAAYDPDGMRTELLVQCEEDASP